jgi:hypothetical protein
MIMFVIVSMFVGRKFERCARTLTASSESYSDGVGSLSNTSSALVTRIADRVANRFAAKLASGFPLPHSPGCLGGVPR